jgi:type IV pilus assembly protein PilC
MIIFIIPTFATIFEQLDTELPWITRFLLGVSENSMIVVPAMFGGVILIIAFFKYFKSEPWLRRFVDTTKFKAPVFGELNKKTAIARMCRNLSMMIQAGEPLTSALKLTAATSGNIHIEESTEAAIEAMNNGTSFSNSMRYFEMFPPMVKQMIAVGDETGRLAPMLDTIADFYENDVSEMSERLAAAIEPLMIMVLGGIVGVVLFAMYMPMFNMYGAMGDNM